MLNFLGGKKSNDDTLLESLKAAFKKVKQELDDHLSTINENTADIQELNETILNVEHKIDKLAERLDELELLMNPKFKLDNVELNRKEQEVFAALFIGKGLSLTQLSKVLGITVDAANMYLFNLISKGVPIQKEMVGNVLVFSVDPTFKDMQARRNILKLDQKITKQLLERQN
jgi:hypothetical protein